MASTHMSEKEQWRSRIIAAIIYFSVFTVFVSVCVLAVTTTMQQEKTKETYKQITVETPISFFDHTYMEEGGEKKAPETPPKPE